MLKQHHFFERKHLALQKLNEFGLVYLIFITLFGTVFLLMDKR